MIFDLVKDFAEVLEAMPEEHPRRRILKLLHEAIRRDVHFIDRHPTTFFQCMWNTCWWYDCPEAAGHDEGREVPGETRARRLSRLLANGAVSENGRRSAVDGSALYVHHVCIWERYTFA